jgi:uracil-DNA glycosylase
MQVTDRLKEQLGSWCHYLTPFIESDRFDKILAFLKQEVANKKTVIPDSALLFKSFQLCDIKKVKAIILLMDPYPTIKQIGKNSVKVSNGIPLDCSNTNVAQPSLQQWYGALTEEYGFDPDMEQRNDISYLLTEEHVLLLNSSLTVVENTPGSHVAIWTEFMSFFFSEVINVFFSGLPIVLVGKQAQQYEKDIDPFRHHILKVEHMAAAAYQNRMWNNGNMFQWINKIVENNNGYHEKIKWKRARVWQETRTKWEELPSGKKDKTTGEWVRGTMPWDNVSIPDDLPF